jgi:hypothetical protein
MELPSPHWKSAHKGPPIDPLIVTQPCVWNIEAKHNLREHPRFTTPRNYPTLFKRRQAASDTGLHSRFEEKQAQFFLSKRCLQKYRETLVPAVAPSQCLAQIPAVSLQLHPQQAPNLPQRAKFFEDTEQPLFLLQED